MLCQGNRDLTVDVKFGSFTTHLWQHGDITKRKGNLKKHEEWKAGSYGGGSGGSSSEKDAGASLTT